VERCLCGQPLFQRVAHKRPDFLHCILARDLSANLSVEVLGTGACRLAGNGESVLQHQYTECQQRQLWLNDVCASWLFERSERALLGGEVILAADVRLDVRRRNARGGLAFCLNFFLNLLVDAAYAPCRLSAVVGVSIPAMGEVPSSGTGGNAGLVFCCTSIASAGMAAPVGMAGWGKVAKVFVAGYSSIPRCCIKSTGCFELFDKLQDGHKT
jgi:hypothetical protein